jgi:hypothetical protein
MKRLFLSLTAAVTLSAAQAQDMDMHADHDMAGMEDEPMGAGPNMQSGMAGALGNYAMTRDGSGTGWLPQSSPMEGLHGMWGNWSTMLHGSLTGVYTNQGGPRGDDQLFSQSMLMGMAQSSLGDGTLTLRGMVSLDPFMGKRGYPLLLQTGETADGVTHLVDRQHPHDLFMEMSGAYSYPLGEDASGFVYFGYPGEPALGPVTFMHRFSGMANPEAPIGHHWLDATHITFGVLTAGVVLNKWKFEGSLFKGREPDEQRWNFDSLSLDSASARISFNPDENWSLQASYGYLKSPEKLEPTHDQHRITASAIYNLKLEHGNWQTTFAWGRNIVSHGDSSDAFLVESAASWYNHILFARTERAGKNELFPAPGPLHDVLFNVGKFSLGYVYDIPISQHVSLGLGAMGSVYALPSALKASYGDPKSYTLFTRIRLM